MSHCALSPHQASRWPKPPMLRGPWERESERERETDCHLPKVQREGSECITSPPLCSVFSVDVGKSSLSTMLYGLNKEFHLYLTSADYRCCYLVLVMFSGEQNLSCTIDYLSVLAPIHASVIRNNNKKQHLHISVIWLHDKNKENSNFKY